jgi:hypothetical protein
VVQGDLGADGHGLVDDVLVLRAVDRDELGRNAAAERRVQLAAAERVAPQPLLAQDVAQRRGQVRLDGRQDVDRPLGPVGAKRGRDPPGVAAQLPLGHDREWGAVPARQLGDVAVLDEQAAVANRQAVVDSLRGHVDPPAGGSA